MFVSQLNLATDIMSNVIEIKSYPLEDHLARNKGQEITYEELKELCVTAPIPPMFVFHTYTNQNRSSARYRVAAFDKDRYDPNYSDTKLPFMEQEFHAEAKAKSTFLHRKDTIATEKAPPHTEIYLMGKVDLSQRPALNRRELQTA